MDPYKVLQVHTDAEADTIQAAYRALLRRFHPDKNPDSKDSAEHRTRELNAAYTILSDPEKRRAYDESLRRRSEARRAGTTSRPTTATRRPSAASPETEVTVSRDSTATAVLQEMRRLETEVARFRVDNRELRISYEQVSAQATVREEELANLRQRLAEVDAQRLRLEQALSVSEKQCEILRTKMQSAGEKSQQSPETPPSRPTPPRTVASASKEPRILTLPRGDQTMTFLWIPGGTFQMGSPVGKPDERPVHSVTLDPFWMAISPITNKQFSSFLRGQPTWSKRVASVQRHPDYLKEFLGDAPPIGKDEAPVTGVTWHAAAAFCQWAGFRLPTEAEWECAARAGRQMDYATSNGALLPRLANYSGNVGGTTPAKKYPPNPYGLYDLSGNVWEWCSDEYDPEFYALPEAAEMNPHSGERFTFKNNDVQSVPAVSRRVIRGGSWRSVSADLRTSARAYQDASLPTPFCGFRCILLA